MLSSLRFNLTVLFLTMIGTLANAQNSTVEKIDLNKADVATLDRVLEGVGEKKAQAIVDYREKHGPFQSIYDLTQVMGIGEKIVEKNKDRMEVSVPKEKLADSPETSGNQPPSDPPKEQPEASSKTE